MLTRLPSGLAVPAALAAGVLSERFPGLPLRLSNAQRARLLREFVDAGVHGGSTYDGIVALEASARGEILLTLDQRAQATYTRLGASFRVIEP